MAHLASASGGIAAFLTSDLTREGILEALRSRRVYATNGPRIVMATRLGGRPMGADVGLDEVGMGPSGAGSAELTVWIVAPGPLDRVDVIRSGQIHESVACDGERDCRFATTIEDLEAGEYLYVRAVQADGGAAWSSPYYLR
jgi:hypothetical protein